MGCAAGSPAPDGCGQRPPGNAWEAEAALGGAKLFLIGSPYASDFCFSDIAGGPLQVRQTLSSVTSTLTEILGVSLSVHWLCLLYWRLSTS